MRCNFGVKHSKIPHWSEADVANAMIDQDLKDTEIGSSSERVTEPGPRVDTWV